MIDGEIMTQLLRKRYHASIPELALLRLRMTELAGDVVTLNKSTWISL